MAFGAFLHRQDSRYDDIPAERYHFPKIYLSRVERCVGDWIVYYEPRKVAKSRGYFALAKVQQVISDLRAAQMYFALIEPGSYLDFAEPVPFAGSDGLAERGLLNDQGRISGRAQSAVRLVSTEDFQRIIERGLRDASPLLPRIDSPGYRSGMEDEQQLFIFEQVRVRNEYMSSRILRDRVFRQVVLRAYQETCAITGLKLINGRGRAEVEAAHIRPVEANGPDIVTNGLALSGTAHWMFDRGLLGVADDLTILVSRHVNDTRSVQKLINVSGKVLLPKRLHDQPHPLYLQWHRENCFKA